MDRCEGFVSKKTKIKLAISLNSVILSPVMRGMTDNQFRQIAIFRKTQLKEWKAIPENKRPTWEQFKRGLKVKTRQK